MNRLSRLTIFICIAALALTGCGSDGSGPEPAGDFAGDWVLVQTIVQKAACLGGEPSDTLVDELAIQQDGSSVLLQFAGFAIAGSITDGALMASGQMEGGEAISVEFRRSGSEILGELTIEGDGCQELRSVVGRRLGPDRDFNGHWGLQLTVMSEGGCEFIQDYVDCFRIIQDEFGDLLVVDEDAGNLWGEVTGGVAKIERDTLEENTWLIMYLSADGQRMSGSVYRYFSDPGCATDLSFTAVLRQEDCQNPKHQL